MKQKILFSAVIIFFFLGGFSQVKDLSYSYQYLLTYDGAQQGDYVGKFYSCFTYDTIHSITFTKVTGNAAFDIELETGMIFIDDASQLNPGKDTLGIEVCDGEYCETYKAVVSTVPADSCIFIDPASGTNGDGSFEAPFDSWKDIPPGMFQAGYAYLQKRGTTELSHSAGALISVSSSQGTPDKHISIGAYGTGDKPVVINANSEAPAIIYGKFKAEGAKYVDTYSLEVRDCSGVEIENATYNEHLMLTNITISNCSNNANFYVKWPGEDQSDMFDMNISVYNMISFNPRTSHCIKADRTVNITNADLYKAKRHGLSIVGGDCTMRYIHSHHNDTYGIELQDNSIVVEKSVVHHNSRGIKFDNDNWKNNTIDSSYIYSNSHDGIELSGTDKVTITNSQIFGNYGNGLKIETYSDSIVVAKNTIHDNFGSGILITNYVGYGLKTFEINRNVFYGNKESLFVEEGRHVFFYNNTCFGEGINETTSGFVVAKNNILASLEGTWVASNNLITETDSIYVDAVNNDFHQAPNAFVAIDQGTDVGLTTDFDDTPVPQNSAPDIGAFEFKGVVNSAPLIESQLDWKVYPNPCNETLVIENQQTGLKSIEIINITGKMIFNAYKLAGLKHRLNLTSLPDGVYLLKLTDTNDKTILRNIVKQ